ncbi:MAG: tetratricopeptide repeat protein [Promethearchaeota archaeon]|jgi:tetratricopeptide (TPR) repeat protein
MTDPKPKEFLQTEELISKGKTEEALEIVRKFQQTAWTYFFRLESDKAMEVALQSKELIEEIGKEIDFAENFFLIGHIYLQKGNLTDSLNYGMKSLKLREKLKNRANYGASLSLMGLIHWSSGNYNKAIEFCKNSLSCTAINSRIKADNLRALANIFLWKGDFSQSLKYSEEGLKIAKNENLFSFCASFLWYMGLIFTFMDEFNKAKDYLKRCYKLAGKYKNTYIKALALHGLINISTEENSINQAKKYLEVLREYAVQEKNKITSKVYSLSKGLVLIAQSRRIRDRAEAEALFRQIIDEGISNLFDQVLYMYALYFLIYMYVEELMMSNDLKILDDINPLVLILYTKAKELQSNIFLIEVKIFQANVKLIQKNFDKGKKLLIEAQQLAESTNNQLFAQLISNEHDRLLMQQEFWLNLEKTNIPFSERIELGEFDGILNPIQGRRSKDLLEAVPEKPVFLLIITESGNLLFSHSFSIEISFEDDIISSFISAFNTFSGELFSKGLDRAKFGDYIILMESVESYSVCYLFKGQSYPAKQKLSNFVDQMQNNSTIWQNLNKFYKTSQVAEIKDLPQIEILIKDIFLI